MKKFIVLVLALILVMVTVACGQGTSGDPDETTAGNNGPESSADETTGSGAASSPDESSSDSTEGSEGTDDPAGTEDTGKVDSELQDATTVDETVYLVVESAYYRSAPDVYEKNIAGRAVWGDSLNRICYNSDWSIILLNGVKYYLPTASLSKTQPTEKTEFSAVSDTVSVVDSDVVVRTAPISDDATAYATVEEGTELRRVRCNERWSVVAYDELELYIEVEYHSGSDSSVDDIEFTEYTATVSVTASEAVLYSIPSTDLTLSEAVATVVNAQQLETFSISGDGLWYGVYYLDSESGITLGVYVQVSDVAVVGDVTESEAVESDEIVAPEEGDEVEEEEEEEEEEEDAAAEE